MDEVRLIAGFRSEMPRASDETRRQARELLARQFEPVNFFGLPRLSRRSLLILAAVALGGGILAGSALAFGNSLFDSIRGKPAPPDVRRDFENFRSDDVFLYDPGVIPPRARGVLSFQTSIGRGTIWAAPLRQGGVCLWVRIHDARTASRGQAGGDSSGGGCYARDQVLGGKRVRVVLTGGPAPNFVVGFAAPQVRSVEVHLLEGGARRTHVYDGVFAVGNAPGTTATTAVAFDAKGRKVGSDTFWPEPSIPPAPVLKPTGPFEKLVGEQDGYRVSASIAPATGGGLCLEFEQTDVPSDSYCESRIDVQTAGPLQLLRLWWGPPVQIWRKDHTGEPVFWGYIFGRAAEDVSSVELRFEDRSSMPVPLERDHFFLALATGDRARPGHRPQVLVGRDRAGRVVATRRLDR